MDKVNKGKIVNTINISNWYKKWRFLKIIETIKVNIEPLENHKASMSLTFKVISVVIINIISHIQGANSCINSIAITPYKDYSKFCILN